MIGASARKFFGSAHDRRVKEYPSRVNAINALEPEMVALSDEALKELRKQLAKGQSKGQSLNSREQESRT